MGQKVTFESNWTQISGYLAEPAEKGPAVIVIHEWWGIDSPLSNIRDIVDRFAQEGFVAFAPDFYRGESADNPEDAGRLMTEMFQQRMEEVDVIFRGSVDYLRELEKTDPIKVGVTGFCCGGTLSMYFAAKFPELVDASVPFYGLPQLVPNGVEVQAKIYAGVNHAFLNDRRPEVYDERAAKDAWAMTVHFFKRHLS